MQGAHSIWGQRRGACALGLMALALMLRMLVPVGWMPATDGRSITLCTGMGAVQAWIAADGTVHEKAPQPAGKAEQPCVFAGLGAAIVLPDLAGPIAPVATPLAFAPPITAVVAIGRGLAAPPPPPTGPPATF